MEQLQSSHDRKISCYQPLLHALQDYVDEGWQVAILPWVVGVRGLVKETHLNEALEFLAMPSTAWKSILEASVRTSVGGFAFLNQVCFSTPQAQKTWGTLDHHGTDESVRNANSRTNGKRRRAESGKEDLGELVWRWRNVARTRRRHSGAMDGNRRAKPAPD